MPRPSTSQSTSGLSIAELERLLDRRRREHEELVQRRGKLQSQIEDVDEKIRTALGSASGAATALARTISTGNGGGGGKANGRRRGRRGGNARSLIETMQDVLGKAGGAMSVGDIVKGVEEAGYHSRSANFRGIVNQTLIKERTKFTNAGRGMYKLA